ncbi:tripartite motif-containing protein 16-like protein [Poeciliopsis prolifica]|uniref:tripartite motif-containing protein 16-like protein n=1 Tax=Poeciliopsis prolifica TaxID=188132 RepID=UPI0024137767|nr:tripartite motif-containing protein 16-like protein [Poeciliopsis prolifica]
MAQKGLQLDEDKYSCSICLDLLKDPVTIPCGHSYCMSCIRTHWDEEDHKKIYSCPQCREAFKKKPVLKKSTILADLVEDLKRTGVRADPDDHCYAGPGDVACDVCTQRKLKAVRFCLTCPASYCEYHLQPHYDAPPLQKHKLVDPSKKLQENICPHHGDSDHPDQQDACFLCLTDENKDHKKESGAAEMSRKQKKLLVRRQQIQKGIWDREKEMKLLWQEVEAINASADKAAEDSEKIFTELIRLTGKRSTDVQQQIRSQQESEVSRVRELQEKLEREITELKKKDAELEKLSNSDHNRFLLNFSSLSIPSDATHSSSIKIRPLRYFEDVTTAVSELRDKLQNILRDTWSDISDAVAEVDVLLSEPEPKTRAGFLKYSQEITLNPNTANSHLLLSDGNRKATVLKQKQLYSDHPDRFTSWLQILSRESLTGRCYWEVEWKGRRVDIAASYKSISRAGNLDDCEFRSNYKSWSLYCDRNGYTFWHNRIKTPVSGPVSSRVGVYLDHRAGTMSFYSVSGTMTLLHRVQATFTEPLLAGVGFYKDGISAELLKLN